MNTLCELFREQVEAAPGRVAVHCRGVDTTYEAIARQADSVAAWLLQEGLQKGDRVALLLDNSAEYVACYLGILQAGGVVVALNPDTTVRELAGTLGDASPVAVVVGRKAVRPLAEWAATSRASNGSGRIRSWIHLDGARPDAACAGPRVVSWSEVSGRSASAPSVRPGWDDVAQLIYTSGTTGRPKGVTLSHRNLAANCRSILDYLDLTADDGAFVILPFFYSYGNSLLFTHLAAGARLIVASDFVFWNRALDLMESQRATGFSGVPSSYAMLLHRSDFRKRRFSHLRYMTCAGGGLAPAVVEQLREIVPDVRLFLMYGQTEATARLSTLMPDELDAKLGSIGRGIPGVTIRVLDEAGDPTPPGVVGEIVARGDNVMLGYWNDQEETARVLRPEGLRTGDLAWTDEDGYVYIAGRKSDMIKSGAYRINPKEIEDVILELEAVAETAVVGFPDEVWGESPVAFVVLSPNAQKPTASEIVEHCRRHLPRYKRIREARFVDRLPRTSSGKIKRAELRDLSRSGPDDVSVRIGGKERSRTILDP